MKQFSIRIPEVLWEYFTRQAAKNHRSLNGEITARLWESRKDDRRERRGKA